jgi:hypothetical protein
VESMLTALARVARFEVFFEAPPFGSEQQLLPVDYEPSVTHGGVLISAAVPASAPEGSRVVISRAFVAGCDMALGEAPLQVIVGFNHAPETEGPVYIAAEAGDVAAVKSALEGGASTEEMSTREVCN